MPGPNRLTRATLRVIMSASPEPGAPLITGGAGGGSVMRAGRGGANVLRYADYEVAVIGAGPSGAQTARFAAAGGLRVLLLDRKAELGVPTECSGAVSVRGLQSADVPLADEYIVTSV